MTFPREVSHSQASAMAMRLLQLSPNSATGWHSQFLSSLHPPGSDDDAGVQWQPSPATMLPSSHCSPSRRLPSPCRATQLELKNPYSDMELAPGILVQSAEQSNPHSMVQDLLQPSPSSVLPSSHVSFAAATTRPSPQVPLDPTLTGSRPPQHAAITKTHSTRVNAEKRRGRRLHLPSRRCWLQARTRSISHVARVCTASHSSLAARACAGLVAHAPCADGAPDDIPSAKKEYCYKK